MDGELDKKWKGIISGPNPAEGMDVLSVVFVVWCVGSVQRSPSWCMSVSNCARSRNLKNEAV